MASSDDVLEVHAAKQHGGLSPRAALWIGLLAGGWIATVAVGAAFLLLSDGTGSDRAASRGQDADWGLMRTAGADEEDDGPGIPLPGGGEIPLPDIFPGDDSATGRPRGGVANPGGGTADSNNRAIALSASIGGGQSVVYYFDTVRERVLVYQYSGRLISGNRALRKGDRGGLRLLAARHMDYDLRLHGYRDLSEQTRNQLKSAFDAQMKKKGGAKPVGHKPLKVNVK